MINVSLLSLSLVLSHPPLPLRSALDLSNRTPLGTRGPLLCKISFCYILPSWLDLPKLNWALAVRFDLAGFVYAATHERLLADAML